MTREYQTAPPPLDYKFNFSTDLWVTGGPFD